MDENFESEQSVSRDDAAATFRTMADALSSGSLAFGEDRAVIVPVPDELDLEVELETEDGERSVEVELEWSVRAEGETEETETETPDVEAAAEGGGAAVPEGSADESSTDEDAVEATVADDEPATAEETQPVPVGPAGPTSSLARFEIFRDRADEWRWRLVHRNGNVIATSGESYTRKHNARKGLRSVMRNAPEADLVEDPDR